MWWFVFRGASILDGSTGVLSAIAVDNSYQALSLASIAR
jgi:hypothetical protein